MSREVRRVPRDWEHPKGQWPHRFRPLHDHDFETVAIEWKAGFPLWNPQEHDGYEYWELNPTPDRESCRPKWNDDQRTHWQLYETVSEGTPLSPPLPTIEALAGWLTINGDYWMQTNPEDYPQLSFEGWLAFLKVGWAPSSAMRVGEARYRSGYAVVAEMELEKGHA